MQKRNFYALQHVCFRWLTLSILLVSIAIMGVGCSSDDDTSHRKSTVTTTRDAQGVWFVAGSEKDRLYDVFEAAGYAVACDRLWQAETFRRSAKGTLAEIFGPDYLQQDSLVRMTGYTDAELTAAVRDYFKAIEPLTGGYYDNIDYDHSAGADNYGPAYARLSKIKRHYDPRNLFRLNSNIRPA